VTGLPECRLDISLPRRTIKLCDYRSDHATVLFYARTSTYRFSVAFELIRLAAADKAYDASWCAQIIKKRMGLTHR